MTRVPPMVLLAVASLGLIVAAVGLMVGWPEVAPIGFFILIFCTILATMQRSILAMQPYQAPLAATPTDAMDSTASSTLTRAGGRARIYNTADEPTATQSDHTP